MNQDQYNRELEALANSQPAIPREIRARMDADRAHAEEIATLKAQLDAAQKACAEMRDVLTAAMDWPEGLRRECPLKESAIAALHHAQSLTQ